MRTRPPATHTPDITADATLTVIQGPQSWDDGSTRRARYTTASRGPLRPHPPHPSPEGQHEPRERKNVDARKVRRRDGRSKSRRDGAGYTAGFGAQSNCTTTPSAAWCACLVCRCTHAAPGEPSLYERLHRRAVIGL